MEFKVENITPSKAAKYLESNLDKQRHVSKSHIAKLVQMMHEGEFDGLNGQTIKFNGKPGSETLIDGQHRLHAVIQSGRNLKIGVLRGCSSDAFETIDNTQASRSVENYYQIEKQEHSKVAAQVARWVFNMDVGKGRVLRTPPKAPGHIAKWAMENHPDIPTSVGEIEDYLNGFQKAGLGTKAHLAFCYYLWRQKDPRLALDVARYLGKNEGEPPNSFKILKQYLMETVPRAGQRVPGNVRIAQVVGGMVTVWNAERSRSQVKSVRGLKRRLHTFWDDASKRADSLVLPECQ